MRFLLPPDLRAYFLIDFFFFFLSSQFIDKYLSDRCCNHSETRHLFNSHCKSVCCNHEKDHVDFFTF